MSSVFFFFLRRLTRGSAYLGLRKLYLMYCVYVYIMQCLVRQSTHVYNIVYIIAARIGWYISGWSPIQVLHT